MYIELSSTSNKSLFQVSFKNTPKHFPVKSVWESIRVLDDEENWLERAQVITKEDHCLNIEFALVNVSHIVITGYSICGGACKLFKKSLFKRNY